MTVYRRHIRAIVLRNLGEVRGDQLDRYAQVVGMMTALLDDDKEMVAAINEACHGKKEDPPCSAA